MRWAEILGRITTRRPGLTLIGVGVVTLVSLIVASGLELRMNWMDLLPDDHPVVVGYRDIFHRFTDPSLVVVLEGERDATVAMARELEPRLRELEALYNVEARLPVEFLRRHGAVLLKPEPFDRYLRSFADYTLLGVLRGTNDDYEREYTSSESNIRRDEVDIARGVLGLTRSLELLSHGLAGSADPGVMGEAADAMVLGDPWMLSLDRRMLLIACSPVASVDEIDRILETVAEVEEVIEEVAGRHPAVYASTTGMAKISQDEMHSVGLYTQILGLIALVLIYLLLSRAFGSWIIPVMAIVPLLIGIFWTMGLLQLLYGSLNLFTAMMMLVLLGLGIDFSIHVISRFQEELKAGYAVEEAAIRMFSTSGTAVVIGAMTTALAFFTLLIGKTRGVHEFGAAAGCGVFLTLISIFLMLPSFMSLRIRRGKEMASAGQQQAGWGRALHREHYRWIGTVAGAGWRYPGRFLAFGVIVIAAALYGSAHIGSEYDFLELEAKGLRSVELQREIPERYGMAEHAAWLVAGTVEEARDLKERLRRLPGVGEVAAISDYLPSPERLAAYRPRLEAFRAGPLSVDRIAWPAGAQEILAREVDRLWDNLDLMSNLAFTAGLDRIVGVIDQMTGLDAETGESDPEALLPTLAARLAEPLPPQRLEELAGIWSVRMRANLMEITSPEPVEMTELPGQVRRAFLPRSGSGNLVYIYPRGYLWDREDLERFAAQTESVDPGVVGTEKLILVMMDETLRDGRAAALLALGVIALLLIVHMRSPIGLLALIPLGVGLLLMLGLMYLFGMKYDYMNLIATPIILGIGIDDGVHALHRFRGQRGEGSLRIADSYRFVGKAILLTSLTTMIGFGSVAFYEMRGMAGFGKVLFMGVGTCFIATVLVLPPVLRLFARKPRPTGRGVVVAALAVAAAAAGLIPFSAARVSAQGVSITGYYENTLQVDYTRETKEQLLDASKLRLDFGSDAGNGLTFTGNVNWIVYHGEIARDLTPYLPERVGTLLSVAGVPAEYVLQRERIFLDNAFLSWDRGAIRFRAGKQQLSWGPGYSFNPTDLFHRKNLLDPTYEKEGVTALRFDLRWGFGSQLSLIAAPGDDLSESGYALRFSTHLEAVGYDAALTVHAVTDSTSFDPATFMTREQRREAIGLELTGSLLGLGVWLEGNYNRMGAEEGFMRVIGGLDYTLHGGLYLLYERLYNERAAANEPYPVEDWLANLTYGEPMGQGWHLLGVRKDLADLSVGSLYLFAADDGSFVLNPRLDLSVAQDADLILFGGFTFGEEEGAFPPGLSTVVARLTLYF